MRNVLKPFNTLHTCHLFLVLCGAVLVHSVDAGELPVVTLSTMDSDLNEAGLDPGSFLVTRQGGSLSQALTVQLAYGGTAVALAGDYVPPPSSIVLDPDVESLLVPLTPRADNRVEGTETIEVSVQTSGNYTLGTEASVTLNLADDPALITISVTDDSLSEIGLDPAEFQLTRSGGNLDAPFAVNFNYAGTANPLADYQRISSFNFSAGQTTGIIPLLPRADNLLEGDETIVVTIASTATYLVADPNSFTLTLTDDAPVVNVTVVDDDMSESGLNPGAFLLSRSGGGDVNQSISVSYTLSGTATQLSDYQAAGGTVIAAGDLNLQLDLIPQPDSNDMEGDETIVITLQPAGTYLLGPNVTATVTLRDLVELIFRSGFENEQKSCVTGDAVKAEHLVVQGPIIRDQATGLMWTRCGQSGVWDAMARACVPAPGLSFAAVTVDDFNAGRAGDNAGFNDWRLPEVHELDSFPAACRAGQAVR